jgi:hypothetical protein
MFLKSVMQKSVAKSTDFSIVQQLAANELNYFKDKQRPLLSKEFNLKQSKAVQPVHVEKNVGVLPKQLT